MNREKKNRIKDFLDNDYLREACEYIITDLHIESKKYYDSISVKNNSELRFAHYTSIGTLYSILTNEQIYTLDIPTNIGFLRLYDAISTNDPNEEGYFKNELIKENKWLEDAEEITDAFVCSFVSGSKEISDKLIYWQSYGIDGLGCSIQLSTGYSHKKKLRQVSYGEEGICSVKKKFKDQLELGKELYEKLEPKEQREFATKFWKAFDSIKFLHKHHAYKNEKEYRYVLVIDSTSKTNTEIKYHFKKEGPYLRRYTLVPEFKADEILITRSKVVIGPRVPHQDSLRRQLKKLAVQANLPGPEFISSSIPYRKVW